MNEKRASELTGLSVRTIKNYASGKYKLINPFGRGRGHKLDYDMEDVRGLLLIKALKGIGFTLSQIKTMLDAADEVMEQRIVMKLEMRIIKYFFEGR